MVGGAGAIRFMVQVVRGRWFMMFASFMIMSCVGGSYVFGIYSKSIKTSLGYDQTTLNLLGFFKDLGGGVGIFSGLIAEVTPTWFILLVGAAANFFGYFMVWLAVTGKTPNAKIWQMCLYIFIGANSLNFANTGVLLTCVRNFPEGRGIVLGLLKGFTGLSGALMTQIYLAVYGDDATSLILLVGWFPTAILIVFVYTIRTMNVVRQEGDTRIFYYYFYVAVAIALFIMGMTILQKRFVFTHVEYIGSATFICVLLLIPLLVAIKEEYSIWTLNKLSNESIQQSMAITVEELPLEEPNTQELTAQESKESFYANIFKGPEKGEDYSILQAVFSIDMLLILITVLCGVGTNLAAVDNMGQIGESLGYPIQTISTFISLLSIWNFFGRVFAGFVSEVLLEKMHFPRPLMLAIALILSAVGHVLIAFPISGSLYISSVIIGFCIGVQVTLFYTIISELFGIKHFATLFNCGQTAAPLGSYVFNVQVAGKLYDKEALRQLAKKGMSRDSVRALTCIGSQCYRSTFIILASASVFGAFSTLILVMRTRKFYEGDIYKKFKAEAKADEKETAVANGTNQH